MAQDPSSPVAGAPGFSLRRVPGAPGVFLCLAALSGLAWLALLRLADHMSMGGMSDMEMSVQPWTVADFILRLAMWITMMVGMMLPSAAPMILLFRRVVASRPWAPARVGLFTLAYVLVWGVFSLLATLLQNGLEQLAWLSPMSMRSVPWLGGSILILAGVYQWLPAKRACLTWCRSPLGFLLRYPLASWGDSWRLGIAHGLYCIGCCWALMGVLFAVGAMNLLWAAALAAFVLVEKLASGPWLPRLSGFALVGWGLAVWSGIPV